MYARCMMVRSVAVASRISSSWPGSGSVNIGDLTITYTTLGAPYNNDSIMGPKTRTLF